MDISERIRALACPGERGGGMGFERGASGREQSGRQAGISSHKQHCLSVEGEGGHIQM